MTIRLVVGDPTALTADDTAIRDRLTMLGYDVVAKGVTDANSSDDGVVYAQSSGTGNANYAATAVPVVSMAQNWGSTGLMLAVNSNFAASGATTVIQVAHPIAAGRAGTVTMQASGPILSWFPGGVAAGATRVGTAAATARLSLLAFETGDALYDGSPAPARRVGFGYYNAATWTPDAAAMFDATMAWLVPVAPTSTTYPAAGTTSASTVVAGAVVAVLLAAGTVAGISRASGSPTRVTRTLQASGVVTATSGTVGNVTALLPAAGTVAAASNATGSATRVLRTFLAGGTVAATSGTTGTVSIIGGPATLPASGTVNAASTTAGVVTALLATAGTTPVVAGVVGGVTVIVAPVTHQAAGTVAATSGTSGNATIATPGQAPPDFTDPGALLKGNLATAMLTGNPTKAALTANPAGATLHATTHDAVWRHPAMSKWKTGDTWPPLEITLTDAGQPVDLTAATAIAFHSAPKAPATITINAPMQPADPTNGVVRYLWQPGDLDEAGTFRAEAEVTWGDGTIQTFPPDGYLSYTVADQLDAVTP